MFWKIILGILAILLAGAFFVIRSYYVAFKPAFGGYFIKKDRVVYFTGMQGLGTNRSWVLEGADLKSFKKLGNRYAKDKNRAYLGGKPIRFSQGSGFVKINETFSRDQDRIYYYGEALSFDTEGFKITQSRTGNYLAEDRERKYHNDKIVAHVDGKKWALLQKGYSIDRGVVFYKTKLVRSVELRSFRVLPEAGGKYAMDMGHIYFAGKAIKGADPHSFEFMPEEGYSKDKNCVYYEGKTISRDANHFEFLNGVGEKGFMKDSKTVYWNRKRLFNGNALTFQAFNNNYGKDSLHAYYRDKKIFHIEVASFEILSAHFARDKAAVIYEGKTLTGPDVTTFQVLGESYGQDKSGIWYKDQEVDVKDTKSFTTLSRYYAKDKLQVYYTDQVLEGADAKSFEVVDEEDVLIKGIKARDKNGVWLWGKRSEKEG